MSKYIDRSKVIDEIVRVLEHTDCKDEYIDRVLMAIESLPTIEVSEDCISREGLLKYAYEREGVMSVSVDSIRLAPSVVPTTPKGQLEDCGSYEVCKDCREKIDFPHWRFCPNCGKELRGVNDVI